MSTSNQCPGPRPLTQIMCWSAASVMLTFGGVVCITREFGAVEAGLLAAGAVVGFPSLLLLARDLMSCPQICQAGTVFRLGIRVGRMRGWGAR